MTLFTFTASCWLVTKAILIPGKSIVNPPCYTEEEAVLNAENRIKLYRNSILVFYCNVLAVFSILKVISLVNRQL